MKTKIITDSLSDISPEIAKEYDIEVLPIRIALDSDYMSVNDVSVSETIDWILKNEKQPKFKGVNSEVYAQAFEESLNQGREIVCSKLLSNYDCACHASTRFPDAKIEIIDSHQLCVSVGFMAIKAAQMSMEGDSAEVLAFKFKQRMHRCRQYGIADTVDFLQYAGICPKVVSIGSSLLNAKFEFEVQKDMHFVVKVLGTSMKKAIPSYCKNVFKDMDNIDPNTAFIMYTQTEEKYFSEVYKYVSDLNYFDDVILCRAGHYTNSLVGCNGISIAFQLKK
jgi:DegV family protein with EDD domain